MHLELCAPQVVARAAEHAEVYRFDRPRIGAG